MSPKRVEHLAVRGLLRAHPREQLDLDPVEEVRHQRRGRARRQRQVVARAAGPTPRTPTSSRSRQPPTARRQPRLELLVGQPRRPELPQHAHVARADVLVEEVAGRAPLLGERAGLGVERALALEQLLVLALEHGHEQPLHAAEVVVDERERDAGLAPPPTRVLVPPAPCSTSISRAASRIRCRVSCPRAARLSTWLDTPRV